MLISQVTDYAGYLAPIILTLCDVSGRSPAIVGGALAILLMAIHLALPIFIAPHYSCLLTLLVPAQNTIQMLRAELHPPKPARSKESEPKPPAEEEGEDDKAKEEKQDAYKRDKARWAKREAKRKEEEEGVRAAKAKKVAAPQWILFWLIYTVASLARGYVGIVRPGWKGWLEVWRTVVLTVAGGPWFSPTALS